MTPSADVKPGFDRWSLVEPGTGRVVVEAVKLADRYLPRLAGLQFRRPLPGGHGLLLVPCASVHTMWLRFSLDLLMLGDGGAVLDVRRNVRPWRAVLAPAGTCAVLETTAGVLAGEVPLGLTVAARAGQPRRDLPRSLRFLDPHLALSELTIGLHS